MLKTAPEPVDVQELQFKLYSRINVFENTDNSNFPHQCNLVAAASRFGLIFVGTNTSTLQAIQLKEIQKNTKSDGDKGDYSRRTLPLPAPPSHLSVNCENTILAVVIESNNCPCALFYDVKSFWQQEITKVGEIRLSPTPAVHVTEVAWNPALASIFTACKSDGTLGIYELKGSGIDINELPAAAGATCFCWSPKGKQIAVGSRDGKITQLKPDLKAVKVINAPPLKEPHMLVSLQWISNYQFIGVFQPLNPDGQANVIVIDAPKTGDPTYLNYDDICYSNGNTRPVQYYMILVPTWNILMAASSNSMEVGILGNTGENWTQWIMGDAARAELPLSTNHQETLPIGCALDIGSTEPIPWGESTLPPAPMLLLFSHYGTLCFFNIINLKPGVPSVCCPPDDIKDVTGLPQFINGGLKQETKKEDVVKVSTKTEVPAAFKPSYESPKITTVSLTSTASTLFTTPPQLTSQGLNLTKPQSVNLFGGQATLTPVTQNKTPQPNLPTQYSTLFQSLSNTEVKNVQAAPVVSVPASISVSPSVAPKSAVTTAQPDLSTNMVKLSQPEPKDDFVKTEVSNVDLKAEEEAEQIFAQLVKEELLFLESELQAIFHQGKTLKLNVGSDDGKMKMLESLKSLDEFFNEVVESCVSQNAEVHILKQNVLQCWAWYEEAKFRHLTSEDESLMTVFRAQPLDSASEKQLADIQHTNYYLESQISQAHLALDEQWENFQDYCKKTHKVQIPTMEMIFQTMVKHHVILRKQNFILKDLASRIKSRSRSALGPPLLISVDNIRDLPEEFKKLRMNAEDIGQMQYEHVKNKLKNFTKAKASRLRSFFATRERTHISAVKPEMSTSVIQALPVSKSKQYSFLSPKTPSLPPKKLDFVQSTPKSTLSKPDLTSGIASSTPIDGLQKFALKFQTKHFSNVPEQTFAPVKNIIASSPNSAFVSTAFGSNTSTSTVVPSTLKTTFLSSSETVTTTTVVKTTPSFGIVTTSAESDQPVITISTNNLSKPFSFSGSSASLFGTQGNVSVAKPIFFTPTTKPPTSNTETGTTAATVAKTDIKPTTSLLNLSTKPTSSVTPSFSVASLLAPASTAANPTVKTPTSSLIFGSTVPASTSTFSFGSLSTNIFGSANQKPEASLPTATSKPFMFAPKTTASAVTSPSVSKLNTSNTVSTPQAVSTAVTSTETKAATVTQSVFTPLVTSASKSVTQPGLATVSSSILVSTPTTTSSSLLGSSTVTNTVQRPFSSTPATTGTAFSLGGVKQYSPLPATSLTASGSPVATVAAIVTTPSASTVTTNVASTAVTTVATTSIFGTQSATSKPSIFGSVSSTSSAATTAATKFSFGDAVSNKPLAFSAAEATKPSLFANVPTSPPSFGSTPSTSVPVATTQTSLFSTTSSVFGTATTTASQPSIFGSTPSTVSQPSIFGSTPSTASSGTPASQPSIFGTAATTTPSFGTPTTSTTQSIFGATSTFGGLAPVTTQSSVFGSSSAATSAFGSVATTTQSSIFGTPSTSTTTTSLFGAVPPSSSAQPIFGSAAGTSVFGSTVTSTAPQSIFGGSPATTTSQSQGFGLFGDASQKTSIFGSPATSSNQPSVFGSTNQSTIFGGTPNTTTSVFGQNQTPSTFGQSVFGASTNTFGNSSVFGTPSTTFGQHGTSIFGSAPTTTSANIFGGGTATTGSTFPASGSVFGTPTSSAQAPFGSTNQNTFAASPNTGGSFGFGGLNVGSTATTSSSGFAASPASNPFENKSVFGSPATSSSSTIFGGTPTSPFGGTQQNFGSGFGSQPAFGQQTTFGQSSFGTFGQASAGPFSNGSSGSVGQSGFGTSSNFQKPGGFGSSPVFGGSPAFGSSPTFGGTASFGSSPSFGNSPKVFGAASPGFGAATTSQNSGFGNLANQPTVGFGNLAQQAANAQSNTAFSGSSSFSSWR